MRRVSAADATWRFTSGGAADTTSQAPSRSRSTNGRSTTVTAPSQRSISARAGAPIAGATSTISAPVPRSPASFAAATGPPPTTSTRRPASFRKTGNRSRRSGAGAEVASPWGDDASSAENKDISEAWSLGSRDYRGAGMGSQTVDQGFGLRASGFVPENETP